MNDPLWSKRWRGLALALLFFPPAAQAQAPCVPRNVIAKMAFDRWGEVSVLAGTVNSGEFAMELFVGPQRTFTVIHVQPIGDCAWIVSAGADLLITGDVPPPSPGEPM